MNQLSPDVTDAGGIFSLEYSQEKQNTSNDLNGNTAGGHTYENTGEIQYEFLDNVDFDAVEDGSLSAPTALMMSVTGEVSSTPASDIEVIPKEEKELLTEYMEEDLEGNAVSRSSLDSVVVEEIAKESFAMPKERRNVPQPVYCLKDNRHLWQKNRCLLNLQNQCRTLLSYLPH